LCVGHQATIISKQLKIWIAHAKTNSKLQVFEEAYPVEDFMNSDKINDSSSVAIRGFGLTMIDIVRALSIGKGGEFDILNPKTFRSKFVPSLQMPKKIVVFSINGKPLVPKPLNADIDSKFEPTEEEIVKFGKTLSKYTQGEKEVLDDSFLKNAIAEIESGKVRGGTAIGMGLATAVNRLKDTESESKVIILLTDGVNNRGQIKPLDAARIAKTFDIKVHTIGVGSKGKALTPVGTKPNGEYLFDYREVEIDEETLTKAAEITGGKYFRATSTEKLREIYKEIDSLEKTEFEVTEFSRRTEEFLNFGLASAACMLFAFLLRMPVFRYI
jgi:hypothetical protein